MGAINYKRALQEIKEFNSLLNSEVALVNEFQFRGYNLLQAVQQQLMGYAKNRSLTQDISKTKKIHSRLYEMLFIVLAKCINTYTFLTIRSNTVDTLIFSIDSAKGTYKCDFRLEKLYSFHEKEQLKYIEVFHTINITQLITNLLSRKRKAFYLIGFLPLFSHEQQRALPNANVVSLYEGAMRLIQTYQRKIPHLTDGCTRILRKVQPRHVFLIDDTRHYYPMVLACTSTGIPSIALQHGHFTKYHIGWINMDVGKGNIIKPTFLVVWSDFWKKELARLGSIFTANELFIGSVEDQVKMITAGEKGANTVILIPYEIDAPEADIQKYIKKLLQMDRVTLLLKFRKDIEHEKQLVAMTGSDSVPKNVFLCTDDKELPEHIDAALGAYSTYLYTMIGKTVPVGLLDCGMDFGHVLLENDLAKTIQYYSLREDIQALLEMDPESRIQKREKLKNGSEPLDQTLSFLMKKKLFYPTGSSIN